VSRPKNRGALRRSKPRREPYDRVLIVCEGSKTEPNYLRELVAAYQLSSTNVEITGEGGSAPKSVVNLAIDLFERDPDYDRVYCVFDKDGHVSYGEAVQRVHDKKLTRRSGKHKLGLAHFEAITSVPCFEYWVLLHYEDTTAPVHRYADLLHRLRRAPGFETYDKGARGLFETTRGRLETALTRADRANEAARHAGTDNPSTQIPTLIRYLMQLRHR